MLTREETEAQRGWVPAQGHIVRWVRGRHSNAALTLILCCQVLLSLSCLSSLLKLQLYTCQPTSGPETFNSSLLASEWSPKLFGLGTQGLSDGASVYCLNLISYNFLQQNLSYSHTELLTIIHFAYADFPMSGLCWSLNSLLFPILQGSNQRLYVSQSL